MNGVICCGLIIFIQIWTMEQKGPVFVSMFNPLGTVLVAILAYFVLGEQLHMGSILGGVLIIVGIYLLLWGKENDQDYKSQQQSFQTHAETSAEQEPQRKGVTPYKKTYSLQAWH